MFNWQRFHNQEICIIDCFIKMIDSMCTLNNKLTMDPYFWALWNQIYCLVWVHIELVVWSMDSQIFVKTSWKYAPTNVERVDPSYFFNISNWILKLDIGQIFIYHPLNMFCTCHSRILICVSNSLVRNRTLSMMSCQLRSRVALM
jgi:hypothetical protein